jgi:hypothetical protein
VKDTTARWTDNGIIGGEQFNKMAANLGGLFFHAGIGQGLPAACLICRGFDFHPEFFQQE